jgi:hypothetical protein
MSKSKGTELNGSVPFEVVERLLEKPIDQWLEPFTSQGQRVTLERA